MQFITYPIQYISEPKQTKCLCKSYKLKLYIYNKNFNTDVSIIEILLTICCSLVCAGQSTFIWMSLVSSLSGGPYLPGVLLALLQLWSRTLWRQQRRDLLFRTAESVRISASLIPSQRSTGTKGCALSTEGFPSPSWVCMHILII